MAITKVVMPKLSEAMETGKVIKWLKKEGDRVQGGDILAEIETDKADVEMEAFGAGVLRKILVSAGEKAPVGTLIGVIAEPAEDIAAVLVSAPAPAVAAGAGAAGGASARNDTRSAPPAPPPPAPSAPAPAAPPTGPSVSRPCPGRSRHGGDRTREGFAVGEEDRGADGCRSPADPRHRSRWSHHPA